MPWAYSWILFGILFSPIRCLSYSFSSKYASEPWISQPLASICAWRIWDRQFFSWKLKPWLLWEYMCTSSTMPLNSKPIGDISELSMSEPESRPGCSWNWSTWRIRCLAWTFWSFYFIWRQSVRWIASSFQIACRIFSAYLFFQSFRLFAIESSGSPSSCWNMQFASSNCEVGQGICRGIPKDMLFSIECRRMTLI